MGKSLLQHPWRGLQGGSTPCVEIFCIWWAKSNSFRPFFSQNILKIHLKMGRPYICEGEKDTPPTHTRLKLSGRRRMGPWRDIWNPFSGGKGGGAQIFFIIIGFLSFLLSPFLSFFPSRLSPLLFFRVRACGVLQHPKHPPWTRHCFGSPTQAPSHSSSSRPTPAYTSSASMSNLSSNTSGFGMGRATPSAPNLSDINDDHISSTYSHVPPPGSTRYSPGRRTAEASRPSSSSSNESDNKKSCCIQ